MKITQRFLMFSGLGLLGAASFVPSILASASPAPTIVSLLIFIGVVAAVCAAAAWFGLRCADAVNLPMPFLRRLDGVADPNSPKSLRRSGLGAAAAFGGLFALATIALLRALHLPNLAGPLWSRIISVFFAAGSLEIVIHLFIMSCTVKAAQGQRWIGIVVAAMSFVLFHASGLPGQSAAVITLTLLMNGLFGLSLGALYARYGLEYALLCHAVGHVLAVSFA